MTDEEDYAADQKLPEATRRQIAEMLALGYKRSHLIVEADGIVTFDPEAVELEAHRKVFGNETD